jgi:tetratricopeptide (TPR) repeat protein
MRRIDMSREEDLRPLEKLFNTAMEFRQNSNVEKSEQILLRILKQEPRLAEPNIELAHIYLISEKFDEALEHIQDAIQFLENGGQWLEIEEDQLLSMAYTLQGEIYRSIADQDKVVFGSQEIWKDYINKSKEAFKKAKELDPKNDDATVRGAAHNWIIKD